MMKAVVSVVILILASMLTLCSTEVTKQVRERMVCSVNECKAQGNYCNTIRCMDNAADCGGISCKNNGQCYNGRCEDKNSVCWKMTDGVFNICVDKGERCGGDDSFCRSGNKCVNDACVSIYGCEKSGDHCSYAGGTCKGGACLKPCRTDGECGYDHQCTGGYCAELYCGESYCVDGSIG